MTIWSFLPHFCWVTLPGKSDFCTTNENDGISIKEDFSQKFIEKSGDKIESNVESQTFLYEACIKSNEMILIEHYL